MWEGRSSEGKMALCALRACQRGDLMRWRGDACLDGGRRISDLVSWEEKAVACGVG